MTESPIYLDYCASTPVDTKVLDALLPYYTKHYGNPSSQDHPLAWASAGGVKVARKQISQLLHCQASEVIFTSGASESINLALWGLLKSSDKKMTLITSNAEHAVGFQIGQEAHRQGYPVEVLDVGSSGLIPLEKIEEALKKHKGPKVLSLILANNEFGSLYDFKAVSEICKKTQAYLHWDATQALLTEDINLEETHTDLLSFSGHKIYAPKGVGALYLNKESIGQQLWAPFQGGGQEMSLRPGTLNTPGIVGLGQACSLISEKRAQDREHFKSLFHFLIQAMNKKDIPFKLNGDSERRIFHNINLTLTDYTKPLPLNLALSGFCFSQGSACSSGTTGGSRSLKALGLGEKEMQNTLRISLGRPTQVSDLEKFVEKLAEVV